MLKYFCRKHPKFKGVREPKAGTPCMPCYMLWDLVQALREGTVGMLKEDDS